MPIVMRFVPGAQVPKAGDVVTMRGAYGFSYRVVINRVRSREQRPDGSTVLTVDGSKVAAWPVPDADEE